MIAQKKTMRNLDLREIPAIYINLEQHAEKNLKNAKRFLKSVDSKKSFV